MTDNAMLALDLDELDASAIEIVDLGAVLPESLTSGHGLTELAASGGGGSNNCSCCCCTPCCCCT